MGFYNLKRVDQDDTTPRFLVAEFEDNWADEFDVRGWQLFTSEDWQEFRKDFDVDSEFTVYVGSNQYIDYDEARDVLNQIQLFEVTEDEFNTIKRIFGGHSGRFPGSPGS